MRSRLMGLGGVKVLLLATLLAVPVQAQLPRIRLNTVFPPGGQAGKTVAVTINGDLTAAATELLFSHPGIEATQQIESPTEYRVAHRKQRQFDVRIAEDVPNGRYEVRALGPAGLSNPRSFMVTRLTERRFEAGSNSREQPFALQVAEVVNAATRADKRDYYSFRAVGGEPLLIQVRARNIDSRLDAALAVYHRESGRRVGRVNQGTTTDPSMTLVPASDDEYLIEVWDRTFRGGEDYAYRLEVSQRAQVEAIFPPVAADAAEQSFTLYGYNLPGGTPISGPAAGGQLQQLPVSFAPRFEQTTESFASGLTSSAPAGASLDAASFALPAPFRGAENVFLDRARHPVVKEREPNDDATHPQELALPVDVAGQFFPRRDVDWYALQLAKNQEVWVDLASHQLGTNADPILRVAKWITSGEDPVLKTVATADDIAGAPSSREARRLNTTSGDATLRFRADADGTYLISVRDQYNAVDDPRLVYRLRVSVRQPDFQLIALAEPERHGDEKIAKPNGLSVFPGGSALLRVRLLTAHDFSDPVTVVARDLPPGITAEPLVLSTQHREGYLVLQADMNAAETVAAIRVVGTSGDRQRFARTATARRAANNLDSEQTDSRLSHDLPLAVVAAAPPAARLSLADVKLVASPGAKVALPVTVVRKEGFTAELELLGLQVPKGIKVDKVKTKGDSVEVQVVIEDGKLPPGQYTFPVAAKVKEKRPKNTVVVREAEGDLQKIEELLQVHAQRVAEQAALLEQADKNKQAMAQQQVAAQNAAAAPRRKLEGVLAEQRELVTLLAEKLGASEAGLTSSATLAEIGSLEDRLLTLKKDRQAIQEQFLRTAEAQATAQQLLEQAMAKAAEAESQWKQGQAAQMEVQKQKAAAEKRLADVRKAELEQDAEYYVYSPAVQLAVDRSPLQIQLAEEQVVARGESLRVPLLIRRRFGFSGAVTVNAKVPGGVPFAAGDLVLGAGQQVAHLTLTADAKAKPGAYSVPLEFRLKFNKLDLTDTARFNVRVEEK